MLFRSRSVAFSTDGRTLAATIGVDQLAGERRGFGSVSLWNVKSGMKIGSLKKYDRYVHKLLFTERGERLVTAGGDGSIRSWSTKSFSEVNKMKGYAPFAISRDGKKIAHTGRNATILIQNFEIKKR